LQVPEVLVSGNHEEIRRWRRRTALEKTLRNRPDLLEGAALGEEDKKLLARISGEQAATNSKISVTGGQDRD
jgi:tRNA (guanine37-N1)-methyltransferase